MTSSNQAAFDLIVALRGGLPADCDFCGQPFTQARYPVPEEAGAWACRECLDRWIKNKEPGYG
jgi:ribosomal protein L37AE/L43A